MNQLPARQSTERQTASGASVADYIHKRRDTEEFFALSGRDRPCGLSERDEVRLNVAAMLTIDHLIASGVRKVEARRQVADRYRGHRGMTLSSLNIKHSAWLKGGRKGGAVFGPRDWRYFISQYSNGETDPMIRNTPFCEYVAMLQGDCQRDDTGRAVRRRLLDEWRSGTNIPGVGTIAEWCANQRPPRAIPSRNQPLRPGDYPAGWSEWQIARCVRSILGARENATRAFLQRGEHAAMSHWSDQLYRSRANLRPLELITCDDVDLDLYVWMPTGDAHAQVVRPKALFVMDVGTGCILNYGLVGAYTRQYYTEGADEGIRRGIQTGDMKMLLLATLEKFGLPENWQLHFLHEHATAKLTDQDAALFQQILPIKFASTQMMKTRLPGGFLESAGNPKQKGWLESWFRLLHTTLNHLDGTVGRRYELTRGDVGVAVWRNGRQVASRRETRVGETIAILRQAAVIAEKRGCPIADVLDDGSGHPDRLQVPVLKIDQLHDLLETYVDRINSRHEHALEGFAEVIDIEIRPGEYIPDYHPAAQQLVRPGMRSRLRLESPLERFHRLAQGQPFRKPTPREMLVLARETKTIKVANEQVTITPRGQRTKIHYRDQESAEALAAYNGKEVIYFLSPSNDQVHLFTENLDHIASPVRIDRPDIMDETAMGKRMGEVHRGREQIRTETAEIMAPRAAELDEMRAHNARLLGTPSTSSARPADPTASAITRAEARNTRRKAAPTATEILLAKAKKQQEVGIPEDPDLHW